MASKKKAVDTGVQSKTAKRSAGKKEDKGFLADGNLDRIIPLCGGEWAYILNPVTGLTNHVKVGGTQWIKVIGELLEDPKHGAKVQNQLQKLGLAV